ALLALAAVLLDWLLGEPRCRHPLVGFGALADRLERKLYGDATITPRARRRRGALALLLLLLPFTATAAALTALPYVGMVFSVLILYAAIGHKSLHDHARPVAAALRNQDDDEARRLVARMVSRDSAALDITGATTESVLENGNDGVFGALFWFAIAGGAGAVIYRLANTLDAMWGYRNERYLHFGWAAARLDDGLNFIPARLTAVTYAVLGKTRQALRCWRTQAPAWDSPNAGPVMAAGAGALGLSLGGPARYQGEWHQRPVLGVGRTPEIADIERALRLVRHGVWLWLGVLVVAGGLAHA
ncbi:MAG: adenosylcobinamide-phosphate synthase CbiB, partial [Gammaproteobacteria bacterium]